METDAPRLALLGGQAPLLAMLLGLAGCSGPETLAEVKGKVHQNGQP